MQIEHAIYNEETGKWYRMGTPMVEGIHGFEGVNAATYPEAFEMLFGHPVPIPPPARSVRKIQEA